MSYSCDPMDCSLPGSSVHGFPRQEYCHELPFPSSGDLPNPGIKPRSPVLQADSLPTEPPGKPIFEIVSSKSCPNLVSSCQQLVNAQKLFIVKLIKLFAQTEPNVIDAS